MKKTTADQQGLKLVNPGQLLGQTLRAQVVVLLGKRSRIGAQARSLGWRFEQCADFVDQTRAVKKRHQSARFAVVNGLAQWCGVAGNDGTADAHGFEQAPTEYKRIG